MVTGPRVSEVSARLVTVTDCVIAGTWSAVLRNSTRFGEKLIVNGVDGGSSYCVITSVTTALNSPNIESFKAIGRCHSRDHIDQLETPAATTKIAAKATSLLNANS